MLAEGNPFLSFPPLFSLVFFGWGPIAKLRRSQAKRTMLVSLEPPPPLPKWTTVRTSGFNSQSNVYTIHHLKPEVRFSDTPPSQTKYLCHWASANFCDGPLREEVQSKYIFKFDSLGGKNRETNTWTFKKSEKLLFESHMHAVKNLIFRWNILISGFLCMDLLFCNKALTKCMTVLSWSFFVRKRTFGLKAPPIHEHLRYRNTFSPWCCWGLLDTIQFFPSFKTS